MKSYHIPTDIRIEALLSHLPKDKRSIEVCGSHKRNSYKDIGAITVSDSGNIYLSVTRNGLYDILPESLFHPVDRFENIPANEYKEKFKEEIEQQQIEEENARKFFSQFDQLILELNGLVSKIKSDYSENTVISDIIGDSLSERFRTNRFIQRTLQFLPGCNKIRGDKAFITFMLRKVLFEEGIHLELYSQKECLRDDHPRYNSRIDELDSEESEIYLGNEYDETILKYSIEYWKEEECTETFLEFVDDINTFEQFINEYFVSIEEKVKFIITTHTLPVRISDDRCFNYLNYNTNI
jgi:hypothetical protein